VNCHMWPSIVSQLEGAGTSTPIRILRLCVKIQRKLTEQF
jgi:hypothetical protein